MAGNYHASSLGFCQHLSLAPWPDRPAGLCLLRPATPCGANFDRWMPCDRSGDRAAGGRPGDSPVSARIYVLLVQTTIGTTHHDSWLDRPDTATLPLPLVHTHILTLHARCPALDWITDTLSEDGALKRSHHDFLLFCLYIYIDLSIATQRPRSKDQLYMQLPVVPNHKWEKF
jgi:hypothetical protein